MMRTGSAAILFLASTAFSAVAQAPSIDERLVGEWKNSGTGGRCQFFPPSIALSKDYVPHTNPYRPTQVIESFRFMNPSEMEYRQLGPDGADTCRFIRTDSAQGKPQP